MVHFSLALLLMAAADSPSQPNASDFDARHLQGTWLVQTIHGFHSDAAAEIKHLQLTIDGNTLRAQFRDQTIHAHFQIHPNRTLSQMDVTLTDGPEQWRGKIFHGIYLLEGNTLKIVYRNPGGKRPTEFVTEGEPDVYKLFFQK